MQIIKSLITLLVFICPLILKAQTTYLPEGSKEYQFIDRLEIKQGHYTDLNFSTLNLTAGALLFRKLEFLDSAALQIPLRLQKKIINGPGLILLRLMNIIFIAFLWIIQNG